MTDKTPKTEPESSNFSFEHGDQTYTFAKPFTVVRRPGWLRQNRHRSTLDLSYTILEELAGPEALIVLDEMEPEEWREVIDRMWEEIQSGE